MTSQLVSFRLSAIEIEALSALKQEGETTNLVAQRIVRNALGVTPDVEKVGKPVLEQMVEQMVESIVSAKLIDIENRLEKLKA